MVAPVCCSTLSQTARLVRGREAQPTVAVCLWVPDASVKKMMLVSLGMGRRAIAVG